MAIIRGQLNRDALKDLYRHMQYRKSNNFVTHDKCDLMIIVVEVEDTHEISHIRIVGANRLIPSELDAIEEIFMSCFGYQFLRYEEKSEGPELHLVPKKILLESLTDEDINIIIKQAQLRMDETLCLQGFVSYVLRTTQKLTDICFLFAERRRLSESFLPIADGLDSFATIDACDMCTLTCRMQKYYMKN